MRQHLISKVLLRRFTSSAAGNLLRSFDLQYGNARLRHPSAVAWRDNFVAHDPLAIEAMWQETENRLTTALDAAEAGAVFESDATAETLKETIALHFMRRDLVKDSFETYLARAREGVAAPRDFPGDPDVFRTVVQARLDEAAASTFAENIRSLSARAKQRALSGHLEVGHSALPLLIGDGAVLSVRRDGGTGFIPFSDASTHVLPVGRHHLIALAPHDNTFELPEDWARTLNEQHIVQADRHVFFHPDDDLEPFVRAVRRRLSRM